jgi:hypothetical protein
MGSREAWWVPQRPCGSGWRAIYNNLKNAVKINSRFPPILGGETHASVCSIYKVGFPVF